MSDGFPEGMPFLARGLYHFLKSHRYTEDQEIEIPGTGVTVRKGDTFLSYNYLGRVGRCCPATIKKHALRLEQDGYIERVEHRSGTVFRIVTKIRLVQSA